MWLWSEIWLLVDRIGSPSFAGCQVFTLWVVVYVVAMNVN